MFKDFCTIWGSLLIAANAFALNQGDVLRIVYDLQGGTNNPDNISSYQFDKNDLGRIYLYPPTKEGYEFLGWFEKSHTNLLYDNRVVEYIRPCDGGSYIKDDVGISVYARWGLVSKRPKLDEFGCMQVTDAAELYGAVKMADSLSEKYKNVCVSIQNDIVVNKNLLANDGSLNQGNFYWWKPFKVFKGVIEGNGHVISGLYGNVGLVEKLLFDGSGQVTIQNLGIVDSYFSGDNAGSFFSYVYSYKAALLKNVYSTATVDGDDGTAGGLVGYVDMASGGSCLLDIAPPPRMAPSGYEDDDVDYYYGDGYVLTVENAYYAGRLMGNNVGGLVGLAGRVSVKNSFFAGTSNAKGDVSSIGKRRGRICGDDHADDVISENTYFLDLYKQDDFKASASSSAEFSDGTILAKLNEASSIPIWTQSVGTDDYPKLNGPFYDIRYVLNGGVNDTSNPAYYTPKNEITLNPATKQGDTFEGWFLDSNFKEPVDKILATDWGNQKFYAKWKSGYSITYVNDGSYEYEALRNPTYRYADSATFKLYEPMGNGRTFAGWFTDSTFSTRVTELPTGNTEDLVLYGKWDGTKVKLVYYLNGGTMGDLSNPDEAMNGDKIVFQKPTREGCTFRGWFDGVDKKFDETRGIIDEPYLVYTNQSQINLYAKWIYTPVKPAIDADGCYLVTNANELYYFNSIANSGLQEKPPIKSCIKIMNDIDLNEIMDGRSNDYVSPLKVIEWFPLNTATPFVGTIYGNGHTINGFYMRYSLSNPGRFYGIVANEPYVDMYPEVQNLYITNFHYEYVTYIMKVLVNSKGGPNVPNDLDLPPVHWVGLKKAVARPPLKQQNLPQYDVKGRTMKIHPHYGVLF